MKPSSAPKNVKELREDLSEVYSQVRSRKMTIDEAKSVTMVAGKILSSAKTEIEYLQMNKQKRKIAFLEY